MKTKIGLLFLGFLMAACAQRQGKQEVEKRPNILFIIAEDLSPDLGCYGNDLVKTPVLDALASNGMRFSSAFVVAPVCAPSRTAIATGMYPTSVGAFHMRYPDELLPSLPENVKTLPQIFRENGYATANIKDEIGNGKYDWLFKVAPEHKFEFESWKEIADQDNPFFAMVCSFYTHRDFAKAEEGQFDLEKIPIPPFYPDHSVTRRDFANYYASIEKLDIQVGKVMDSLQQYGLAENTIVAFIGDHGRPMSRDKNYNYLTGLQVPLIISIPENLQKPKEYQKGGEFNRRVNSIDLSTTFLDMAGITAPENMQGQVFWGEHQKPESEFLYSATDRIGETDFKSRSIFNKKYHYIRNYHHDFSVNSSATAYRKAKHPIYQLLNILDERGELTVAQKALVEEMPAEELYDIENDPDEMYNLANNPEYKSVLEDMQAGMDNWLKQIDDKALGKDSQEIVDAFNAYGDSSRAKFKNLEAKLKKEVEEAVGLQ